MVEGAVKLPHLAHLTSVLAALAVSTAVAGPDPIEWNSSWNLIHTAPASYPRVVELADKTLLATFDHATTGGRALGSTRSRDGGKTWDRYVRICEAEGTVDLANAFPLQLPGGTILVACRHHTRQRREYQLELYASDDLGEHWKIRSVMAQGTRGLWEPFLLLLPGKILQAYYASEEGVFPDQTIEKIESGDAGKTWSSAVTVASCKGSRDGMPGAVILPGGEILVVFEAQDLAPYRFVIRSVRSHDGGKTWSTGRELVYRPSHAMGGRWSAGAPSIARLANGQLAVSFQTDQQVEYRQGVLDHDPAHAGYRYVRHTSFGYVIGDAQGNQWCQPAFLCGSPESPACWNAICSLTDGSTLALTGCGGRIWCERGKLRDTSAR